MAWLFDLFLYELISDEKAEGIRVRRGWRRRESDYLKLRIGA